MTDNKTLDEIAEEIGEVELLEGELDDEQKAEDSERFGYQK